MLDATCILCFALGFAFGGIFMSLSHLVLFLPKMRKLDKEFRDLRTENRQLKCFFTGEERL